jgi:hypothetical protein
MASPAAKGRQAGRSGAGCPVLSSGSQDTHAQTPDVSCDSGMFAADKALGARVAHGFALAGLPASADLLAHFLKGKGTEVDYRPGSPISKQPLAFRFADGAPR